MAAFFENIWQIFPMLVLLLLSAFMSGSETAFFNISRRQLESLAVSSHRFQNLAARLLKKNPKRLLTSLLFGNMAVNVLFFALASIMSVNLGRTAGPAMAATAAGGAFVMLLLFGEMLPKSLAYSNSKQFAIIAAPLCFLCVRILTPILRIFEFVIIAPAVRLLIGPAQTTKLEDTVTGEQFKLLIESSRQQGPISDDENQLFAEVMELGLLKVRHVMRPRVDMIACEINDPREKVQQLMTENDLTRIPVYEENIDNIVGYLHQRDLLLNPEAEIKKLLKTVNFVPEQKTIESLLQFFRKSRTDTAVAVDEYGGIAGAVSVEDIVTELLGPIERPSQIEPIEQIGPLQYRLAGDLAIHDWAQAFGIDPVQRRLATIAGFATALLGRIPKPGDVVQLKNLTLTVESVKKRRIESLILSLETIEQ